MNITATIAWRNVWRNGRRSWVLISAVAVGVFCFVGSTAFMDSFGVLMIRSSTDLQGGHIQLAAKGYNDNPTLDGVITPGLVPELPGWSAPQVVSSGMVNSSERAAGVTIRGVDPARERLVTTLADRLVEGSYLSEEADPSEVFVGEGLADRLRVRIGEKIVLMVNDRSNEVSAGAYRVVGMYRSGSTGFDRSQVYLHIDEARRLFGFGSENSLVAVRLATDDESDLAIVDIRARLDGERVEALTWKDRNPMAKLSTEMYGYSVMLLAIILFTAVGFTLINSFLMVIFERVREIGVLLAAGVKPSVVRRMLMLEAIFIAVLGTAIGIILSSVLILLWARAGLDLSSYAEGLGQFGFDTMIYPVVDLGHMAMGFTIIFILVMLAVLYPAVRASRFDPLEAMNHV